MKFIRKKRLLCVPFGDLAKSQQNNFKKGGFTIMRKKWLSRALAAMLAGVLTVGLLAGCGAEEKKDSS